MTNGRMLSYQKLVDDLVHRGLSYTHLSVHGGSAQLHNAIVRADAFEQTLAAVENLRDRGVEVTAACVVTTRNLERLKGVVDVLARFGGLRLKFALTEPKGGAERAFDEVVPPVGQVAAAIADAIEYGTGCSSGLQFAHEGLPLCLLPGLEGLSEDLRAHGFVSMSEVGEPDFYPVAKIFDLDQKSQ